MATASDKKPKKEMGPVMRSLLGSGGEGGLLGNEMVYNILKGGHGDVFSPLLRLSPGGMDYSIRRNIEDINRAAPEQRGGGGGGGGGGFNLLDFLNGGQQYRATGGPGAYGYPGYNPFDVMPGINAQNAGILSRTQRYYNPQSPSMPTTGSRPPFNAGVYQGGSWAGTGSGGGGSGGGGSGGQPSTIQGDLPPWEELTGFFGGEGGGGGGGGSWVPGDYFTSLLGSIFAAPGSADIGTFSLPPDFQSRYTPFQEGYPDQSYGKDFGRTMDVWKLTTALMGDAGSTPYVPGAYLTGYGIPTFLDAFSQYGSHRALPYDYVHPRDDEEDQRPYGPGGGG